MENKLIISGGKKLYGSCKIQISKNATLPILAAILLTNGVVRLNNLPEIIDVENMIKILVNFSVKIIKNDHDYIFDTTSVKNAKIDKELAKSMRSSIFLLGPLLMRFKNVMITTPGGCPIGKRSIGLHISSFRAMGVKIKSLGDNIFFDAYNAKPKRIKLRIPSVGATENIVLFAVKQKGKTTIINPAKEPEIVDLCNFLNKMGAKIYGAGTKRITIYGVDKLNDVEYTPIGDRIVAGTVMSAVAICGGKVDLINAEAKHNEKLLKILSSIGCQIKSKNDIIRVESTGKLNNISKIETGYYPNFPTDLQSFMFVLSCLTKGETKIKENLFENRFLIAGELKKMGADVIVKNKKLASICGVEKLSPGNLLAKDLRGGASLVVACLATCGKSTIENIGLIDRGYEKIEDLFSSLGADIVRK